MVGIVIVNYCNEALSPGRSDLALRSIKSLIHATELPYRLVVVDNGAKDDTGLLRKEFCDLIEQKKIHAYVTFDGNRGLGYGRNLGRRILEEECMLGLLQPKDYDYYVFADNDFFYKKGWLKFGINAFETINAPRKEHEKFPILSFHMDGSPDHRRGADLLHNPGVKGYDVRVLNTCPGGCWMMTKKFADDIGNLPTDRQAGNEDWYVIEEVQRRKQRFLVIEGLVRHVGFGYSLWLGEKGVYKAYKDHNTLVESMRGRILDADGKDVEISEKAKEYEK